MMRLGARLAPFDGALVAVCILCAVAAYLAMRLYERIAPWPTSRRGKIARTIGRWLLEAFVVMLLTAAAGGILVWR